MLRHTFRVRSTLGRFRSVPFQTATRLLHDSKSFPSTYDHASIDHKLNNFRSEMEDINKATSMVVDKLSMENKATSMAVDKLSTENKGLGGMLSMEIKNVITAMDSKFEIFDAKTQSKFDVLIAELRGRDANIQSKFDTLRIELRDREARLWAPIFYTLLAVASFTTTAAVLQYNNSEIQTPVVQTPAVQAPTVGQK